MNVATSSLFSQLLSLVDRNRFAKLVRETGSERRSKGFASWDHFIAMLFCQLAQAKSLREIDGGLKSCEGKLQHLGMEGAPGRSTLSYANANRSADLFEKLFYQVLGGVTPHAPGKKFRFKSKLYSLDSTVIELCASMFDWAKFRATKGAAKLHLLLDHDGHLPSYARITEGRFYDFDASRRIDTRFRRVIVWIEEKGEEMELLTNRFDLAAETIAEIYRQRWQIELFFKTIKQNLRIKTFVGTSANAVRIQIWTALIAMLLLKLLQFRSRIDWSLSNLVALLRWNLFTHKNLWKWIDEPFLPPPEASPGTLFQPDLDGILPVRNC